MKYTDAWTSGLAIALPLIALLNAYPATANLTSLPESEQLVSANSQTNGANETLSEALLGHWMSEDGDTHYYFGREQVVVISLLERDDQSTVQHKQKLEYEILAFNEVANWIELEVETPLGWAQTRQLRLDSDRQSLVETLDVMGHAFSSEWTYVSGQQQP